MAPTSERSSFSLCPFYVLHSVDHTAADTDFNELVTFSLNDNFMSKYSQNHSKAVVSQLGNVPEVTVG